MRAAVVTSLGKPLEIQDLPVPELTTGQILVRIETSGICHTDIHAAPVTGRSSRRHRSFPGTRVSASSRRVVTA